MAAYEEPEKYKIGEDAAGKVADNFFGKKKAAGSDRRLFDMDPKINRLKSKSRNLSKAAAKRAAIKQAMSSGSNPPSRVKKTY